MAPPQHFKKKGSIYVCPAESGRKFPLTGETLGPRWSLLFFCPGSLDYLKIMPNNNSAGSMQTVDIMKDQFKICNATLDSTLFCLVSLSEAAWNYHFGSEPPPTRTPTSTPLSRRIKTHQIIAVLAHAQEICLGFPYSYVYPSASFRASPRGKTH